MIGKWKQQALLSNNNRVAFVSACRKQKKALKEQSREGFDAEVKVRMGLNDLMRGWSFHLVRKEGTYLLWLLSLVLSTKEKIAV